MTDLITIPKVFTHNGVHHADEVVATAIIKRINPNVTVVRTRDKCLLEYGKEIGSLIYDVGGGIYDHHSVDKVIRENGIPYSSAGLIWRDYGKQVIELAAPYLTEEEVITVLKDVEDSFIMAIDALDNGVTIYESDYSITSFSSLIDCFNPDFDECKDENEAFNEAVEFASFTLNRKLNKALAQFKINDIIAKDLAAREVPEILVLSQGYPWHKALLARETEVLFVVGPTKDGEYKVNTVPSELGSFVALKDLPESWAGKRDGDFIKETGVKDAVFCHPARFIAGAKTLKGAKQLADLAYINIKVEEI